MTVDPGLSGTGVAIWTEHQNSINYLDELSWEWPKGIRQIASWVRGICVDHEVKILFYEMPMFMAQAHQSNKRGDIIKLAMLTGAIHGMVEQWDIDVYPITIMEWKGQVKKEIMNDRVKDLMIRNDPVILSQDFKLSTHILDAIGIGYYVLGVMK